MSARVLIVKNIGREGPGLLRDVLQANHVAADVIELERGDNVPSLDDYAALVILGGPPSANDDTPSIRQQIERVGEALEKNVPFFGICLGMAILGKAAGGNIVRAPKPEIGFGYSVKLTESGREDPLFEGVSNEFDVFQLHGDALETNGVTHVLGSGSDDCPNQIIKVGRHAYGFQAHIEVVPEMLAVWGAQDSMLANSDMTAMQAELAKSADVYQANAKQIFTNFLSIANLTTSVDVTEAQSFSVN